MRIPKRFKLLGRVIEVKMDDTLLHESDDHGQANYRRNVLALQTRTGATPIPQTLLEHNFYHELAHWILYVTGRVVDGGYLHRDDGFVDLVGGLIHQALTTMEFDE